MAGIAAGNAGTSPGGGRPVISGVAPRAYIGNYKALTVPTDADVGLDGNSPELVAAIEAAVADGMDVINLSLGEPEIEPSRDIVALALDAASRAGVVPVVAAGNDFEEFGRGSVGSPSHVRPGDQRRRRHDHGLRCAGGRRRLVVGRTDAALAPAQARRLGPRRLDPLRSTRRPLGAALRHEHGVAARRRIGGAPPAAPSRLDTCERQERAGRDDHDRLVVGEEGRGRACPTRGGSGVVDLVAAATPLVLARAVVGLVRVAAGRGDCTSTVAVADSGGGAGVWTVRVETRSTPAAALVSAPAEVTVPGPLTLAVDASKVTTDGEIAGTVVLSRGATERRIPFWAGITVPTLDSAPRTQLRTPGVYASTTKGRARRATAYRYPELNEFGPAEGELAGPERVYRVVLTRPVANFGVVIVRRAPGVRVEPRIVLGGDESRLVGHTALPYNLNPYLRQFGDTVLASGSVRAAAGAYDVVFDSPTPAGAGAFTFRYWVNDTAPPTARLASTSVRRGARLAIAVADAGSGVDPATVHVTVDGDERRASHRDGIFSIATDRLARGRHTLRFQISDYQESRNMENVPAILPNTRVLRARLHRPLARFRAALVRRSSAGRRGRPGPTGRSRPRGSRRREASPSASGGRAHGARPRPRRG